MTDAPRRLLAALLLLGTLGASGAAAQALGKRMDRRLDSAPLSHNLWGVVLMDTRGRQLYGRNAARMFIPASNTKLVVSAVAAALLPPEWTVLIGVYADGPVEFGEVRGDLILYGRGDPTFGSRCYAVDTSAAGHPMSSSMRVMRSPRMSAARSLRPKPFRPGSRQ